MNDLIQGLLGGFVNFQWQNAVMMIRAAMRSLDFIVFWGYVFCRVGLFRGYLCTVYATKYVFPWALCTSWPDFPGFHGFHCHEVCICTGSMYFVVAT